MPCPGLGALPSVALRGQCHPPVSPQEGLGAWAADPADLCPQTLGSPGHTGHDSMLHDDGNDGGYTAGLHG